MAPPVKLAHFVLRTSDVKGLAAWYCNVLEAKIVHDAEVIIFATYDEEHHRIAFIDRGTMGNVDNDRNGVDHIAFTYANLGELLECYERLKIDEILPVRSINHGPTTSMYYEDPDGNKIELQVDNFATPEEAYAFMSGPVFTANPIGVEFDPDLVLRKYKSGESISSVLK